MKNMWNERYDTEEFIYGLEPNEFFASNLEPHFRSKLLLPGEGEGRNAFYASSIGWDVHAFDLSEVAAAKAMAMARLNRFVFEYEINDVGNFEVVENYYDAVGLIYLHLLPELRTSFHRELVRKIKPGGTIILECFSRNQIVFDTGGPKDISMLYSKEELEDDFRGMKFVHLEESLIELNEGIHHKGTAAVIRFVGVKENQENLS